MNNVFFKLLINIILVTSFGNIFALPSIDKTNLPANVFNKSTIIAISYLLPMQDNLKYCNGDNMDSDGFRKTITRLEVIPISPQRLSREDLIKKTIVFVSKKTRMDTIVDSAKDFLKIRGDTAYIMPIDGWAGASIFMCAWRPLVEVNLLRFPDIKKVEWLD